MTDRIKIILIAIWTEPKRVWKWWNWHSPIIVDGKKKGWKKHNLLEACRAVYESPEELDAEWEKEMETKFKEWNKPKWNR